MSENYLQSDNLATEEARIDAEYRRRAEEVSSDLYAPWNPAELLMTSERRRIAAQMLQSAGNFPKAGSRCLEIGYGSGGWLPDLISWGINERDLYGIELSADRATIAKEKLPAANLEIGSATELPWKEDFFDLIVVSTVFSSILEDSMKSRISSEMHRVLRQSGAILWYDIAVNNPSNPHIKRIDRRELQKLFPGFAMKLRSITLAPPIARRVSGISWSLATLLSAVPFLRSHMIGVFTKN